VTTALLERIAALHQAKRRADDGRPVEASVAELVQALVLDELATGRKIYPTNDWIKFSMEGEHIASVDISLRFMPPDVKASPLLVISRIDPP
jgi:hypothetical protein